MMMRRLDMLANKLGLIREVLQGALRSFILSLIAVALSFGASSKERSEEDFSEMPGIEKKEEKKGKEPREEVFVRKEIKEIKVIKKVVLKYQKSRAVGMKVKKKLYLSLMGEEKIGRGRLWYSKGKLKMEITKPEGSLLVMNDDIVWVVSKLPKEFGGRVQVTKMKATNLKKSNALLAVLFGDEKIWDKFELMSSKNEKAKFTVELKPFKGVGLADVAKVRVQVDSEKKQISEISYWDDLENMTQYEFSKIRFGLSLSKKHFSYEPPSNAEITEI